LDRESQSASDAARRYGFLKRDISYAARFSVGTRLGQHTIGDIDTDGDVRNQPGHRKRQPTTPAAKIYSAPRRKICLNKSPNPLDNVDNVRITRGKELIN
jgi:hypothetical protein